MANEDTRSAKGTRLVEDTRLFEGTGPWQRCARCDVCYARDGVGCEAGTPTRILGDNPSSESRRGGSEDGCKDRKEHQECLPRWGSVGTRDACGVVRVEECSMDNAIDRVSADATAMQDLVDIVECDSGSGSVSG